MPTPTDVLRAEHQVILIALTSLDTAAARLAAGHEPPAGWWERAIDFLRSFADRNHHAKEEQLLFPALVQAGVPSEGGPVGVMLAEHEQGRALIRAMAAGGDAAERAGAARRYVALLREHIAKEDGVLWPMAESVLDDRVTRALAREFEAVEARQGTSASLEHAEATVKELERALG
ncbi:MAG TPA: hypothetical protein DDZ42_17410 [Candidatus Rokubacteria bacterium]|nr:hypothetical protein [Candidatus Rokubacteria bacterium]